MKKEKKKELKKEKRLVFSGINRSKHMHLRKGFICPECLTGRYADVTITMVTEHAKMAEDNWAFLTADNLVQAYCPKCGSRAYVCDELMMSYVLQFMNRGYTVLSSSDGTVYPVTLEESVANKENKIRHIYRFPEITFGNRLDDMKSRLWEGINKEKIARKVLDVKESIDMVTFTVRDDLSVTEMNQLLFPRLASKGLSDEEYAEEIAKIDINPKMTLLNLQKEMFWILGCIIEDLRVEAKKSENV